MKPKKTDNRSLADKLALRRWTLERANVGPLRVLDLCAGAGLIWAGMRRHVAIEAYVPCDREPRLPGCIKGEAVRLVEAFDLSRFSVVDVDTYGEPWEIWLSIARRVQRETAVFLTAGLVGSPMGPNLSSFALAALGIPSTWDRGTLPFTRKLCLWSQDFLLAKGAEICTIKTCGIIKLARVTYYGLVIGPKETRQEADTSRRRTPTPRRLRCPKKPS